MPTKRKDNDGIPLKLLAYLLIDSIKAYMTKQTKRDAFSTDIYDNMGFECYNLQE